MQQKTIANKTWKWHAFEIVLGIIMIALASHFIGFAEANTVTGGKKHEEL